MRVWKTFLLPQATFWPSAKTNSGEKTGLTAGQSEPPDGAK